MLLKEKKIKASGGGLGASKAVDSIIVTPFLRWAPTEKLYLTPQRWLAIRSKLLNGIRILLASFVRELILFCFCFKRWSLSLPSHS